METTIPLIVSTSPASSWTLRGFFYQFEKHVLGPNTEGVVFDVYVVGYGDRPEGVPPYASYIDTGDFSRYPANMWTDGFALGLQKALVPEQRVFWFMLDDYWIIRDVDIVGMRDLFNYHFRRADSIIKIDLAFDRLYSDPGRYTHYYNTYDVVGHMDLIASNPNSHYHMSLWGGLFSQSLLLSLMQPGWSAQEVELTGTHYLSARPDILVLGTRQAPVLHTNVVHNGKTFQFEPYLSAVDMEELIYFGYTEKQ